MASERILATSACFCPFSKRALLTNPNQSNTDILLVTCLLYRSFAAEHLARLLLPLSEKTSVFSASIQNYVVPLERICWKNVFIRSPPMCPASAHAEPFCGFNRLQIRRERWVARHDIMKRRLLDALFRTLWNLANYQ